MAQPQARVLFVGKYGIEDTAGNAVAIRRLISSLESLGVPARYVQSTRPASEAAFALFGFTPTVVHALHAGDAAKLASELAGALEVPLVVTVTGTDLNATGKGDLTVANRLRTADAVVALSEAQLEQLASFGIEAPVVRIPQSVELGSEAFELREALAMVAGPELASKRIALLAGGLRPVKGQLFALEAFEQAGSELAQWLLVLAGPVLDEDYAETVRARARALANAVYIGEIPHDAMPSAMAASDIVLNSSESEGEAQVLLEAQCQGVPVVARRVIGNTALIEDGVTGWLFSDQAELSAVLGELDAHPASLAEVAAEAQQLRQDRLDVQAEADAHLALYHQVMRSSP